MKMIRVSAMAIGIGACGVSLSEDIPFWGQETPPTNRVSAACARETIPGGTDFRIKTVAASAATAAPMRPRVTLPKTIYAVVGEPCDIG